MDIKRSFSDVLSEVHKDSEDISAGIGFFYIRHIHKNYVRNLTSKLARSTLTSSSTIKLKIFVVVSQVGYPD